MMLRYATIMQRGVKQSSDAYARIMASVGSLERVVELHDRGVFRDAAKSLGTEEFPVSKPIIMMCTAAVNWVLLLLRCFKASPGWAVFRLQNISHQVHSSSHCWFRFVPADSH
jgi:hypothetical protein